METTKKKSTTKIWGIKNAGIVIICCFIVAICIFKFFLGSPANFVNNDPNNHPLNLLGTVYKGGVIDCSFGIFVRKDIAFQLLIISVEEIKNFI